MDFISNSSEQCHLILSYFFYKQRESSAKLHPLPLGITACNLEGVMDQDLSFYKYPPLYFKGLLICQKKRVAQHKHSSLLVILVAL